MACSHQNPPEGCFVNLAGDYRCLTSGYYTSQNLEAAAKPVHPTCKEILDGYIVPLFLEKPRAPTRKLLTHQGMPW
jgi:hypothetical protein